MKYKISIVIPVYNTEQFLQECVESIVSQTMELKQIQIVLVNDGSTDHSGEMIQHYQEKYDNVVAIHLDKSHGLGGFARNEGIKKATGQYLMFLDSDDCLDKRACELMYRMMVENHADIVTANYKCIDENGTLWERPMFEHQKYPTCELKQVNEQFFYLYCPSVCVKIFNMNLIKNNHITFLDGVPAEDAYFSSKALLKAKKIMYLQDEIYYYRRRNKKIVSTSWMRNKKYFEGVNKAFYQIYELFKQANKMEYYQFFYAKNLVSLIYKLIDSTLITNEERIEIINEMYWFFEQSKQLNLVFAQDTINRLLQSILSRQHNEVIKECETIRTLRKSMSELQREIMSKPEKFLA